MPIAQSIKGITDFWQSNQGLISDIQEGAKTIADLADQLDQNRKDGQSALAAVGATQFLVATDAGTKAQQAGLLQQITGISQRIQDSQGDLTIVSGLNNQLATLYMALGNTYNSLVAQIVTFTPAEVAQLQGLLQQATLDTTARQRQADLLNGAVQISKFALGFAMKLAA
jgi:hypothetical protein